MSHSEENYGHFSGKDVARLNTLSRHMSYNLMDLFKILLPYGLGLLSISGFVTYNNRPMGIAYFAGLLTIFTRLCALRSIVQHSLQKETLVHDHSQKIGTSLNNVRDVLVLNAQGEDKRYRSKIEREAVGPVEGRLCVASNDREHFQGRRHRHTGWRRSGQRQTKYRQGRFPVSLLESFS